MIAFIDFHYEFVRFMVARWGIKIDYAVAYVEEFKYELDSSLILSKREAKKHAFELEAAMNSSNVVESLNALSVGPNYSHYDSPEKILAMSIARVSNTDFMTKLKFKQRIEANKLNLCKLTVIDILLELEIGELLRAKENLIDWMQNVHEKVPESHLYNSEQNLFKVARVDLALPDLEII